MAIKKSNPRSEKRPITPEVKDSDLVFENKLRPATLTEYIGQEEVKKNLEIFMEAAKGRKEPLEHILLYGPPGLGKTTLSYIIAKEMGTNLRLTSGPLLDKAGDLASILTNLKEGEVLFIDEIHRLKTNIEEVLYTALEDFALDIILGKGPSARTVRLEIPKFTLVGATTKASLLSAPLRDRFGSILKLNFYTNEELGQIIQRSAKILNTPIEEDAIEIIAQRARRTPRIANRLLRRVRDYAQVKHEGRITKHIAEIALKAFGVDELGLDQTDRELLETLIQKFAGGPVGLKTLAAATNEDEGTIEDVYEPFLIQLGFLERTSRGRVATLRAAEHLGLSLNSDSAQKNLFE